MILSPLTIQKYFDNNGQPANKYRIFTYLAGTSTKTATYTDSTGGSQNTNPIVLNARGEANVWLDPTISYKFVFTYPGSDDPPASSISTVDNIPGGYNGTIDWTQIKYDQTLAESAAGVTPTNTAIPHTDAVGVEIAARQGWSAGASGTTNYTALVNAHSVANQAATNLSIGGGTYTYKPSAELQSLVDLYGAGMSRTIFNCDTTFTGRFLRCTGKVKFSDFEMTTIGLTKVGTALFISDPSIASNTAYAHLSHIAVLGFATALEIGNMSLTVFDHCRFENNTEGCWCVPDSSGGNGFVTTIKFRDCAFVQNARNVHFNPQINSVNVEFDGGTIESATGGTASSDFTNIVNLIMRNVNLEGNTGIPSISCSSCGSVSLDSITLTNDAGPIVISDTNTLVSVKNIQVSGTHCVLTISGTTDSVVIENCTFPASGNTFPANTTLINTTINGRYYGNNTREIASYTGARFDRFPSTGSTAISGAGATDVYRFLDVTGTLQNPYISGDFFVRAIDHSTGANFSIYKLTLSSAANGTGSAALTQTRLGTGGTDPGTSATPFSLANDGAGGAVKLQFTKNGAITQVDMIVVFVGFSL